MVYVYKGDPSRASLLVHDSVLTGAAGSGYFGLSMAIAGDLTGDGFDDLVVGAPSSTYGSGGVGDAYWFPGSASGVSDSTRQSLPDPGGGNGFGYITAGGGDIRGAHLGTAIVASYIGDYARIYYGAPDGGLVSTKLLAQPTGSWNYPAGIQ